MSAIIKNESVLYKLRGSALVMFQIWSYNKLKHLKDCRKSVWDKVVYNKFLN